MLVPLVAGFLAGLGVSDFSKKNKFSGTCMLSMSGLLILSLFDILNS